jgi:hypothetical protein
VKPYFARSLSLFSLWQLTQANARSPWVSRAPVPVALGYIFGHKYSSSMILLKIDTESISGIEFESDTPRTIDMDRVAGWNP